VCLKLVPKVADVPRYLLLAATLAAAPLAAEERPLTLAEAQALALERNPELQAAAARVEAQRARADAARRMLWPRLGLSATWSRTDLPAAVFAHKLDAGGFTAADFDVGSLNQPDPLAHLGSGLQLELPIDAFGKVAASARGLTAGAEAAEAAQSDAAQEVRARVLELYRQAEVAGRAVAVTERALAAARAREAEMEARVETGGALAADRLRARARRRAREADAAARRSEQRTAHAGLGRLLGATEDVAYVPTEPPPEVVPLAGSEPEWAARAAARRPALASARRRRDAAEAQVSAEKRGRLPDLSAFGQLWDNRIGAGDAAQAWAAGVSLRWAPFDPVREKRLAAAAAERRAVDLEARAVADQVRLEVALAYRRALTARERHAAAAGGAEEGREALRVVQERRTAGLATLTDELETEAAALAAALAEIAAAAEVSIADAALRRAAGEF
jgi:outer membrane protein TolC